MVCDPYVYRTGIAILSVAVGDRAVQSSGRTGNQLFCNYFLVCSNLERRKEHKKKERFLTFLADPSEENERLAIGGAGNEEQEILREIGVYLRKAYRQADAGRIQEEEYERYVELWAHEVKIPLSLFTLLLENRSEEMSPTVYKKMEHVRLQMQSYVEQMLY